MNHLFQFRLLLILAQLILLWVNVKWQFWPQVSHYIWWLCIGYLVVISVLQWLSNRWHQSRLMIVVDLLLLSGFFALLDGISNPLIWCLLIPTVLSALSQSTRFTWIMTMLSNLLYLWLWSLGIHFIASDGHGHMMASHITGMWLGFIVVSLLLTWVTTTLMNRLNLKNQALLTLEKQRQADENIIKMATLATTMAHELGTPLASIKIILNEIKHDVSDEGISKDLAILDSQVTRCKSVLQELTTATDEGHNDEFIIMSTADFITELINQHNDLPMQYEVKNELTEVSHIKVDELFRLACLNVLNNSKSASAQHVQITLSNNKIGVELKFEDDGTGRSYRNNSGMGIGLKLSTRIVAAMGGLLEFNACNQGAITTIKIPVVHE